MQSFTRRGVFLSVFCSIPLFVGTVRGANENGDEIDIKKVPKKVLETANKAARNAQWDAAFKYQDDNKTVVYELEGKNAKGHEIVVEVTKDGELVQVNTEVTLKDVPEVVRKVFKAKYPNFKMEIIFEIRTPDGQIEGYDFEGTHPKENQEVIIFVSKNGKEIEEY